MDDGYVIPGLNEQWTLGGARLMEWIAGVCMSLVVSEIFMTKMARQTPVLACILVGTTFGLAALRRQFYDEERGVRNFCMVAMGICPPSLPAPASLQPVWSASPMRALSEQSNYMQLGLDQLFGAQDYGFEDDETERS